MERESPHQETDHRVAPGAIDIDYYLARARRRRGVAVRGWLRAAVRAVARQLRRARIAWDAHRQRHRLERELQHLDHRQLADIGLARSDVPAVIDGSYFRDASRRPHAPPARTTAWIDRDPPRVARAAVMAPTRLGADLLLGRQAHADREIA
jgi:uncharacterized protein YjiS (DUF1127 family)